MPRISSRYSRLELVGSGAMGSVYKAFDTLLGQHVALKLLSGAHASPDEVDFFKAEFQTVSELDHPNLVKVFDFGRSASGRLFYSMELMPSGALASLSPPLDQETILGVAVQLCRALAYIHSKGIRHGDLKPANVLLAEPPSKGDIRVKLTDFGLASLPSMMAFPAGGGEGRTDGKASRKAGRASVRGSTRQRDSRSGDSPASRGRGGHTSRPTAGAVEQGSGSQRAAFTPRGATPAYAAPEVLAQGTVDFRADLFSLGVMLYELATGKLPFSWKDSSVGLIERPSSLNKNLARETDTLLLKLLEFDPSNRYRDANSVIEAINRLFSKNFSAETETTGISYVLSPALIGREKELETIRSELAALAGKRPTREVRRREDAAVAAEPGAHPKAACEEGDATKTTAGREREGRADGERGSPEPHAGVILLAGRTGIGKSRLAQEAKLFCQLNGVLFSQGQARSSAMPGAPIIEAVRSLISSLPPDRIPKPPLVLAQLLGRSRRRKEIEIADPFSFAESVYQFLGAVSEIHPIAICMEDVHGADPVTAAGIAYLARGFFLTPLGDPTYETPVRLVITLDDSERLTREQRALVRELEGAPYTLALRPAPLTADETRSIVESMFGPGVLPDGGAERIHAATGGLPLHIQQLMAELVHRGVLTHEMGRWRAPLSELDSLPVPKGTRERTRATLASLTCEERRVMEALAVLSAPAEVWEIGKLTGLPLQTVRHTLRDLSRRALVDRRKNTSTLSPGPLREGVYRSLHWRRRRRLHLEAARIIEKKKIGRRDRTHALAHHYLAAGDKEGSLKWGLAAAKDSVKAQAKKKAAVYYKELLKLDMDRALRAQLMTEYGECVAETGNLREAVRIFRKAYDKTPRAEKALRTKLQRLIGEASSNEGHLTNARSWLRKAAQQTTQCPREAIIANVALSFLEHNASRPDSADRHLRRALRAIDRGGIEDPLKSRAYRTAGTILTERGNFAEGLTYTRMALKSARAAEDPEALHKGYSALGVVYHRLGRHARSLKAANSALAIGADLSSPTAVALQLMNRGAVSFDRGRYFNLIQDLKEALSLFRRARSWRLYSQCLNNLALTLIEVAQYEKAFECLRQSSMIQEKQGYWLYALSRRSAMVTGLLHTGRVADALRLARYNLKQAKSAGIAREVYMAYKDVADALLLSDKREEAARMLRTSLEGFATIGERDEVCECLIRLATLEESSGRTECASSYSSNAQQMARTVGSKPIQLRAAMSIPPRSGAEVRRIRRLASEIESPELRWRAHLACARYFVRKGRPDRAVREYDSCLGIFRSITADMADATLRDSYLAHPERVAVFSSIRGLRQSTIS